MNIPGLPPSTPKKKRSVVFRTPAPTPPMREVKAQARRKANVKKYFDDPNSPFVRQQTLTPRTPAAPRAAAPATTTRSSGSTRARNASTTAPSSSPSRATGGGGSSSTGSSRSTRTSTRTGGGGGGATGAPSAGGTGTATVDTSLTLPEYPTFNSDTVFGAAQRELTRQQAVAKARYDAQQRDIQVFNDWLAGKQAASEATLKQTNQDYAAQAQAARQQSLDTVNELTSRAMAAMGGNTNLAGVSGISAQTASTAAGQGAGDARADAMAAMSKADSDYLANQREVNAARAAKMISDVANGYNTSANELAKQGATLDTEIAKARLADDQARFQYNVGKVEKDRQYAMDKTAADWLRGFKEQSLAAETSVALAKTKAQRLGDSLKAQIEAGKLDLRAAELKIKQADLTRKERNDALKRIRQQRVDRRGGRKDALSQVQTFIGAAVKGYGKERLSELDRHNYGQVAHRTIAMLGGAYPQLSRADVVQMISSQFGSDVATDQRILNDITARFRR